MTIYHFIRPRAGRLIFGLFLMGSAISCSKPTGKLIHLDHIVDLTYTLTSEFPYIPVHNLTFPFSMTPMATIGKDGVAANTWHIHEHLGTHLDAPSHFDPNGLSADQISLEDLIVPVVVIGIEKKAAADRDAELTIEDIQKFEDQYGSIPDHSCVMLLSGWGKYVHTPIYLGLDSAGTKHFPGFSAKAIDFLIRQRNIVGVGADLISLDPGRDNAYSSHKVLLKQGRWAIENIANLDKIPAAGATLIVGASKVGGSTGGIARIFAVW